MEWRQLGWLLLPALALLLNMPWGLFTRWAKEEAKSKKEVV